MGGGERAPVALCREPVYVATTVGPGRAPPGRRTRAGRRDQGVGFETMTHPAGETGVGTTKLSRLAMAAGWVRTQSGRQPIALRARAAATPGSRLSRLRRS